MSLRRLVPPIVLLFAAVMACALLGTTGSLPDGRPVRRTGGIDAPPGDPATIRPPPRLVGRSALESGSREPTEAEGRYRHVTRGVGAYRASLEVEDAGRLERPEQVLRGRGFVAGQVVFPDGTPADGTSVRARCDDRDNGSHSSSALPGLVSSEAWTDADGRFRITGLRPGPLVVEAPTSVAGRARSTARAACGAADVRLVVRVHRTRLRVLDLQGRPLGAADVGIRYVREGRCPMGRASVRQADGSRNYWWDPGTHVIVAGHLDGHTVAEEELVVTEQPWTRTVDLVLAPRGSDTGSVRIHLIDDLGRRITKLALVLTSPLARSRLDRSTSHHPDDEGVVSGLPPGTFHVHVYPVDTDALRTAAYCLPIHRKLTIRPRAETRLDLRTVTCGRLRMNERCAAGAEQADLAAYVRFERAGAEELWPLWLDPREDDVSMLLEPGLWTMVVYGEHVREERRAVLVEAGVTRDEAITLLPR